MVTAQHIYKADILIHITLVCYFSASSVLYAVKFKVKWKFTQLKQGIMICSFYNSRITPFVVIKPTVLTDKFYLFHLANVHYNSESKVKVKHRREKGDVS